MPINRLRKPKERTYPINDYLDALTTSGFEKLK